MIAVHNKNASALPACTCVHQHAPVLSLRDDTSDRRRIRRCNTEYPVCCSQIAESDVDVSHNRLSLPYVRSDQILDLFSDLFNKILHLKNPVGYINAIGLGADRIDLSVDLLNQEIHLLTDRAFSSENAPCL